MKIEAQRQEKSILIRTIALDIGPRATYRYSSGALCEPIGTLKQEIEERIWLSVNIIRIERRWLLVKRWRSTIVKNAWTTVMRARTRAAIASSGPSASSGSYAVRVKNATSWKGRQ